MINKIWALITILGIIGFLISGLSGIFAQSILENSMNAVTLAIKLAGGFALWSGLISILEKSGALVWLTRKLTKPMGFLFPGVDAQSEAGQAIAMNMAANMMGLGNAATPMGIKAMELLPKGRDGTLATHAMCMFLVLNASSIQLFPSSVIALRAAAGSVDPAGIVLPSLIATGVSTLVGVLMCLILAKGRGEHGV